MRCVINVAASCSPSYPNSGPLILAEAGVHLVDVPGSPLFETVKDGDHLRVRGGRVTTGDGLLLAEGEVQDLETVGRAHEQARRQIGEAIEAFAENTMTHIRDERDLLAGRMEMPDFDTRFRDRPALVVVRGVDHQKDLRMLRPYVRDVRPVLVGGGRRRATRSWRRASSRTMIVGDMDSATDAALRCGAELVVHAYPGRQRARARAPRQAGAQRTSSCRRRPRARTWRC